MRFVLTLFMSFCVATILTQMVGMGLLWSSGNLNRETLGRAIGLLADGPDVEPESEAEVVEPVQVTRQEVLETRVNRLLDVDQRNREVDGRADFVVDTLAKVREEREAFEKLKKQFEEQLKDAVEADTDEGTAKVRAILTKLPPKDSKVMLMGREVDDAVRILSGMSDRDVAKILKEFKTEAERSRAEEILQAIDEGKKQGEITKKALENLEAIGR